MQSTCAGEALEVTAQRVVSEPDRRHVGVWVVPDQRDRLHTVNVGLLTHTVMRHCGESSNVGWPRPEPQAHEGAQSQHVLAATGVRKPDKNGSLKRR